MNVASATIDAPLVRIKPRAFNPWIVALAVVIPTIMEVLDTIIANAALLAPVVGPTLGGFITDNYGWRWIFYLNLPVGLFALWFCSRVVFDPEYLKTEHAAVRKRGAAFDTLGLCLLSLTMVCWEIAL